jgi:hypothetical protein
MTLAATAGIAKVSRHDETIFYLHREFQSAATSMLDAEGQRQAGLLRRMTLLATALSVIPSGSPNGRQAKLEVARWSHQQGYCTMRLPSDLVASLNSLSG